jgi:pantetheine-phosphate adenylyltransferase
MAIYNRDLMPGLETLFMPADGRFLAHSSTGVKTVALNHGNLDPFVPPLVAEALKKSLVGSGE